MGAGRPAETWLNLVGLLRGGAVDQPYLTPRLAIRGSSVRFGVMRMRDVRAEVGVRVAATQRAAMSLGAQLAQSGV